MLLYLRDRNAKIIKLPNNINPDDFEKMTQIASGFNLRCLPFIDYVGDTILNHKQIVELIKEISFLKNQETAINQKCLAILETAALTALENPNYYLLINGE